MRWSKCFLPTLRESPAGTETVAEKLLVRAGYVRAVSSGVYGYLPLGMRSLARIQSIARAELNAIGGQEVWLEGGAAAETARGELRSAKQLPQVWYRIAMDVFRPRQFSGMDVYWFGAERTVLECALRRIVERCGINASNFAVPRDAGPDMAPVCDACGYIESLATAKSVPVPSLPDITDDLTPEPFHTPGQKTIADLARFTGQPESMQMKSLVLVANGKPVLVMLRGDHQLSEAKFAAKSGDTKFRQATPEELVKWFGASPGSLGPVGATSMPVWMDTALEGRRNMVCGANRDDYHLRHVTPGEDFAAEVADLREVAAGDACVGCGGRLDLRPAMELARVSEGSARVALDRILVAAVEVGHDKDGMVLPASIAPYDVGVAAVNVDAEPVYRTLLDAGINALLDDRDERPGVKFKDADLIGVPWRVTAGRKMAEGVVEVVERKTKAVRDVALRELVAYLSRHSSVL